MNAKIIIVITSLKRCGVASVLLTAVAVFLQAAAQPDTCRACNCQFSNVHALEELIESKVEEYLGKTINYR